jgi:beta-lactamase class C
MSLTRGQSVSSATQVSSQSVEKLSTEPVDNLVLFTSEKVRLVAKPFSMEMGDELAKGTQVRATEKATAEGGVVFYHVKTSDLKEGWLKASVLTAQSPKMQALQAALTKKYADPNVAIYVKSLGSDAEAFVNRETTFYSASLSKIPVLYWTQVQLNSGALTLDKTYLYTEAVNNFPNAYLDGTGTMARRADGKPYRLDYLIDQTAKESDNVAANFLAYYVAGQYNQTFNDAIDKIAGQHWDFSRGKRETTPEMVGRVLEALYDESGYAYTSLYETAFDSERIAADLPVPVAHKIGSAGSDIHDAAIVFAKQPYVLVIQTEGKSEELLTEISKFVYGYLK